MSSKKQLNLRTAIGPLFSRLFPALCGLVFGCALSRLLFELAPGRWTFWATPPGIVLTSLAAAGGWWWLTSRFPSLAPSSPALLVAGVALVGTETNPLRTLTFVSGATVLAVLLILQRRIQAAPRMLRVGLYPLIVFVLTFALYLRTLAPAVGVADSFEFQVGIARLGIAHGSGYPLLMLIGKLFSWLPVGPTFAYRVNLTSAFFGSVASVLAYAVGRRLGSAPLASALAALAFGISPTLWSRTAEVEAYTLNAAFVGALLYMCLQLTGEGSSPAAGERSTTPRARRRAACLPFLLGLLFGLSLTNHLTSLLLAPVVGLALLQYASPLQSARRSILLFLCACILGVSVYAYLPLRWPAVNNGQSMSWTQFSHILRGGEATAVLQPLLPFRDAGRYPIALRKLGEYGIPFSILAAFGLVSLVLGAKGHERRRTLRSVLAHPALVLLLAALPYFYFALAFDVADPDFSAFFIPIHLITATLMGAGLTALVSAAKRSARYAPYLSAVAYSAFCVLALSSLPSTLPRVDRSRDWETYEWGKLALSYPLAPNAAILADSVKVAPLYYLKVVEGERPDLDPIVLPNEEAYRAELDRRIASGQTVYLARYLPNLGAFYSLRSVGPLVQVSSEPFISSSASRPSILHTSTLSLLQIDSPSTAHAGDSLPLTLHWHATAPADANYLVSFRLRDDTGTAWQSAPLAPINALYPTNAWRAGETLTDFHALSLEPTIPPGDYTLEIGLFPPFAETDSGWVPVRPLAVLASQADPTPEKPFAARLGSIWVVGYSAPESTTPGARMDLTLYVRRPAAAVQLTAFGAVRDLSPWPAGAAIPVHYALPMPETGAQETLQLEGADICGWRVIPRQVCELATVQLVGDSIPDNAVRFGDQVLLRAAALGQSAARPGDVVQVHVEWQALQSMAENYSVFVQLVGPDGLLHGQVDQWPVSGTRATSTWKPGEIILDDYAVRLSPDAPSGDYTVHMGLYLLATMRRMPVLDGEGVPLDDKVVLRGLQVTH